MKTESEKTVAAILPAAEREFGERGFHAARLSDIADATGISRPSLLYHHPSKEALYAAVVRWAFGDLATRLSGVLARPGSAEEAIFAVVGAFRDFLAQRPALARLLVRELLSDDGPGRQVLLDEIVPLLDLVERSLFQRHSPVEEIRVREAVLTVAASMLLRRASGEMGRALWGIEDGSERMAVALILGNKTVSEVAS
jgi:AcrR family transcriptional regulator